jgi:hypothetical protein
MVSSFLSLSFSIVSTKLFKKLLNGFLSSTGFITGVSVIISDYLIIMAQVHYLHLQVELNQFFPVLRSKHN